MTTHPYTRLFIKGSAPTVTDDESAGYEAGDVWLIVGGGRYHCSDPSAGAAVWVEDGATGPTTEEIQDIVGAMLAGNGTSGLNITYDDGAGEVHFDVSAITNELSSQGDKITALETGWKNVTQTWTYASGDDPVYQVYVSGNVTADPNYKLGYKVKCINNSTTFYGFIVKVGSYDAGNNRTPVDLYGGTDFDLANSAIVLPNISKAKSPDGFPLSPLKWSVSVTDSSARLGTATKNTWWRPTGSTASLAIPIGVWRVSYRVISRGTASGGTPSYINTQTTLSTATNSETDSTMTSFDELAPGAPPINTNNIHSLSKVLELTTKTTYYLLHRMNTDATASGATSGFNGPATITAECAYL